MNDSMQFFLYHRSGIDIRNENGKRIRIYGLDEYETIFLNIILGEIPISNINTARKFSSFLFSSPILSEKSIEKIIENIKQRLTEPGITLIERIALEKQVEKLNEVIVINPNISSTYLFKHFSTFTSDMRKNKKSEKFILDKNLVKEALPYMNKLDIGVSYSEKFTRQLIRENERIRFRIDYSNRELSPNFHREIIFPLLIKESDCGKFIKNICYSELIDEIISGHPIPDVYDLSILFNPNSTPDNLRNYLKCVKKAYFPLQQDFINHVKCKIDDDLILLQYENHENPHSPTRFLFLYFCYRATDLSDKTRQILFSEWDNSREDSYEGKPGLHKMRISTAVAKLSNPFFVLEHLDRFRIPMANLLFDTDINETIILKGLLHIQLKKRVDDGYIVTNDDFKSILLSKISEYHVSPRFLNKNISLYIKLNLLIDVARTITSSEIFEKNRGMLPKYFTNISLNEFNYRPGKIGYKTSKESFTNLLKNT